MNPVDFVLDVLMLERPRMVGAGEVANFSLPFDSPFFCNDWTMFLFQAVPPPLLLGTPVDLRTLLLDQLTMGMCASGTADFVYARQIEVYRAMHARLSQLSPYEQSGVASWEHFVGLLGQCMDMASHIRTFLCTGAPSQRHLDLYVGALADVCLAQRQLNWIACVAEGRGQSPEPCFRVPHPDSERYTPEALHPFGYDFLPFDLLHDRAGSGLDPSPDRAPAGPEHGHDAASLFKHGGGGGGASDGGPSLPAAASESPAFDCYRCRGLSPEAPMGGGEGRGGGAGESEGWGGAGADALDASQFIPRDLGLDPEFLLAGSGGAEVPQAGPGGVPARAFSVVVGTRHPLGGHCDPCPSRWAGLVRGPGVTVDEWPTVAQAGLGRRRRRWDDGGDRPGGGRPRV
jgi:hypothetical protein